MRLGSGVRPWDIRVQSFIGLYLCVQPYDIRPWFFPVLSFMIHVYVSDQPHGAPHRGLFFILSSLGYIRVRLALLCATVGFSCAKLYRHVRVRLSPPCTAVGYSCAELSGMCVRVANPTVWGHRLFVC